MDPIQEAENKNSNIKFDQRSNSEPNEVSTSTETNVLDHDDFKVKVEIELNEDAEGFIYEADFHGRLQLVRVNQHASSEHMNVVDEKTDIRQWECAPSSIPTEVTQSSIAEIEQNEQTAIPHEYRQLQSASCDITNEINEYTENSFQNSVSTLPEIYHCSLTSSWTEESMMSNQSTESQNNVQQDVQTVPFTLAEKKRSYRMRIKQENPDLWSAIKQKEACKKREQREERRFILLEMQRTMELSHSETSETENQRAYLDALKDRYPELWNQLADALSAAEMRKNELLLEKSSKRSRRLTKPVTMYKDIVEAQKKYLYRQRIKEERPEKYAELKARNTYAKSIKRMMMKKKTCSESNGFLESNEFVFNG